MLFQSFISNSLTSNTYLSACLSVSVKTSTPMRAHLLVRSCVGLPDPAAKYARARLKYRYVVEAGFYQDPAIIYRTQIENGGNVGE
jgi:hypothetical protein